MREIRFRAWDNRRGKMLEVGNMLFDARRDFWKGLLTHSGFVNYVVEGSRCHTVGEDVDLMQFTGLVDAQGHEIYEGDIVQWDTTNGVYRQEVQYDSDQAMFLPNDMKGEVLVIGNVWENPEKMKMGVQEEKRRFIQSEDRGH